MITLILFKVTFQLIEFSFSLLPAKIPGIILRYSGSIQAEGSYSRRKFRLWLYWGIAADSIRQFPRMYNVCTKFVTAYFSVGEYSDLTCTCKV